MCRIETKTWLPHISTNLFHPKTNATVQLEAYENLIHFDALDTRYTVDDSEGLHRPISLKNFQILAARNGSATSNSSHCFSGLSYRSPRRVQRSHLLPVSFGC